MTAFELHRPRVRRLLRDLDVQPLALRVRANDFAIVDGNTGRELTPPLGNQTLAEGLVSAVKLAVLGLEEKR